MTAQLFKMIQEDLFKMKMELMRLQMILEAGKKEEDKKEAIEPTEIEMWVDGSCL